MHIAFQKSGGRGEYEVVGSHTGQTAASLDGWSFFMRWPDGLVRDTALMLEPANSGKPRLRSMADTPFQIGRQVAAMLLLPDPIRDYRKTGLGLPVIQRKNFVLSRVGFGPESEFTAIQDQVTIQPDFVELEDLASSEAIGVDNRWRRIEQVYQAAPALPISVLAPLNEHQAFMSSGQTITTQLTSIVQKLGKAVAQAVPGFDDIQDPLPALEGMLNIPQSDQPTLPTPDLIGEDEPEVSARSAHEYRLARMRGASARNFALAVRLAYKGRCAFCGAVYGGFQSFRSGVEAAHILAWSKYDLDTITNGLSLCRLHHWAFDAALLMPVKNGTNYSLHFTKLADQLNNHSRSRLGAEGLVIPDEWLPEQPASRPSEQYLTRLYADLAVEFVS